MGGANAALHHPAQGTRPSLTIARYRTATSDRHARRQAWSDVAGLGMFGNPLTSSVPRPGRATVHASPACGCALKGVRCTPGLRTARCASGRRGDPHLPELYPLLAFCSSLEPFAPTSARTAARAPCAHRQDIACARRLVCANTPLHCAAIAHNRWSLSRIRSQTGRASGGCPQ